MNKPFGIYKAEIIDKEWGSPLLRLTTLDGAYHFYYQNKDGMLIHGQPYMEHNSGHLVYMFIPFDASYPHPFVLKVVNANGDSPCITL